MNGKGWLFIGLFLVAGFGFVPRCDASVYLSEIFADPTADLTGDANGDGIRSASDDEFVEIHNSGSSSVDLSGWSITDAVSTRHIFSPDTFLDPNSYIVIFGGGAPALPEIYWQTAGSGALGLNNGGDTVSLFDAQNLLVDVVTYGSAAGNDQSIVRYPEEPGSDFVLHSAVSESNALYSPGTAVNPVLENPPIETTAVPEPSSLLSFLLAGTGWLLRKRAAR